MGEQPALLSTLDDALCRFCRIQRERNDALTKLEALEQDVSILRALLSQASPDPETLTTKPLKPTATPGPADLDGLYNNGYRDCVLRRLAATLTQDPDPGLRRRVALALGIAGDPKSIPSLGVALNDVDVGVRREVVIALGRIGTARVVSPLTGALKDTDEEVRDKAITALGRTGKPAIRTLISGLRDGDALMRCGSSDALAMIGAAAISPLAKSFLEEDDRLARIGAVETLGKMRSGKAVASLVMALMDPDAEIQDAAAQALVRTGRPAIRPLVLVMRVAGHPLRRRAAEVLVRTGDLAVRSLVDALADENAEVHLMASEALVKIGRPALGPLADSLKRSKRAARLQVVTLLGLVGDPGAVAPLIQVLKKRDLELRQRAAEALVKLGRPAAGPLTSLLKEADSGLRAEAASVLVQIGRPAFEPLCQALMDADLSARWEAAQILCRLRSGGQLRGLHGEWERTVDEIMLLAWFNSGWARNRTGGIKPPGGSKRQNTAGCLSLMQRLPWHKGAR